MPIATSTSRVIRMPASAGVRCSPTTRNGYPHSSANTVPENWVTKCVHSPRRVSPAHATPWPSRRTAWAAPSGDTGRR